jgi:cytoskeletal protein RodZ
LKQLKPKKDELLNQILQEISDENNEINNSDQENKSRGHNKKISSRRQNIQTITIGTIVMVIIMIFFYLNHETNQINHTYTNTDKSTIQKENQLYKEQKYTELKTKKWDKEIQNIKTAEITISKEEESNAQEEEILTQQDTETERERAKRMLMQQMQN